jgi:hypothetical protein
MFTNVKMSKFDLNLNNEHRAYFDEKELFIFYSLLKNKRISTQGSHVFIPNPKTVIIKEGDDIEELFAGVGFKKQSFVILEYLIELGKMLDKEGFTIFCNADYSLLDGGFLYDDKTGEPIEEYKEAILSKNADKEFVVLVNKLITKYDHGRWDINDAEDFLKIWFQHNKDLVAKEGVHYEDAQKKLTKIIFENIDIHLTIKSTKTLEIFLADYISLYKKDKLKKACKTGLTRRFFSHQSSDELYPKFFGFEKQKEMLIKHIKKIFKKFQRSDLEILSPFVEPRYMAERYMADAIGGSAELKIVMEGEQLFLFVHTMIALEEDNYFNVDKFYYGTANIFDSYHKGFVFEVVINGSNDVWMEKKLNSEKINVKTKTSIILDFYKGFYVKNYSNDTYQISGKRREVVKFLSNQKNANISELRSITAQTDVVLSNSIREINKTFKEKLNVEEDLVKHSKTSGYTLNRDEYIFELKNN